MNDVIKLVLSLSLSGSILALIILAVKPLIRHKVSKTMQYLLWIVVIFRFLVPFSFESSIVNELFYKSNATNNGASSMRTIIEKTNIEKINPDLHHSNNFPKAYDLSDISISSSQPNSNEKSAAGTADSKFNFIDMLKDIFYKYSMLIWILGIMFFLSYNLTGYLRFLKQIRKANRPASDEQSQTLNNLLRGYRLKLFRNRYVKAPMLIGIARPCVIIPDTDFSEKQIKFILLHEINHMKRFDIAIKWLTMIAQAIHWFNPLMYLIRKEIGHACELACDEAVIKNLSVKEKQDYGDTLIDVAAGGKYNSVQLQATMYEEKQSLKDRLTAIMNHGKKSKAMVLLSAALFIAVIVGALYLGAGVGIGASSPPNIYISAEYEKTKKAVVGTYSWNSVNADSVNPLEMKYNPDNIVNISSRQQMSISTQKIKIDRKHDFTLIGLTVYKEGRRAQFESPEPSIINGVLYFQAPVDGGEYIYGVKLGFKDKGQVEYSFVVRVDMMNFDLDRISKLRTPYKGEAWKVSDLAQNLPVPEKSFIQSYISLETDKRPYGLTVFYGLQYDGTYVSEWPLIRSDKASYSNLQKNALVLFCMIDNLDKVTFAFRNSPSGERLDEPKYDSRFTFFRTDFQDRYGC
ncbi:MAG TPA: M56 family metallopeptidase [Pseudobacteroides sp.]|uniref:M56 family metallopeptidase n=1 Tax=Pseudobacteroides sp. TaxID=1968840 RepID=UPI002F931D3F